MMRRVGHAPELVPAAHVDERRAQLGAGEELAHGLARARVEAEDGAQIRARGAQECQAVGLGPGQRALVGAYDAGGEVLEPEPAEEPVAPARRAVGERELLRVEVERRLGVGREDAGRDPLVQGARRGGAALRLARQDEPDHVVRAAGVELGLLGRGDHVVGRRQQLAHVAGARGIVAEAGERTDDGHQPSARAARSSASDTRPGRRTRTRSPSIAATVDAPPRSRPPSR